MLSSKGTPAPLGGGASLAAQWRPCPELQSLVGSAPLMLC
ncbi:hypothetical protein TorRG33x02_031780 [Trema orientale]|uniref:Uncharacterized protein n=1 Tax=Trema orientale TaxID=63057 RepID=A0A2P5FT72_TREOI|nr:hypothetical protein TorRG33x02_031780 [Trema orientale]